MPLPGKVVAAPPGVHGFDTNSVLNRSICEVAKARGFEFCIRYVSRQDVQPTGDLSEAEANVILSAGLALMPVQHVAPENWSPSRALGIRNGKNAAKHARQIGFPEGVNVWLDLEGAKTSTPHETMIAYCNAWFAEVEGAGFAAARSSLSAPCMTILKRVVRQRPLRLCRQGKKPETGYRELVGRYPNGLVNRL